MKNLLGRLMGRSFEELKAIAHAWHISLVDLNHNDAAIAIYREMTEKPNVRTVWETLDPEERAFLLWLIEQRNCMALVDDLPAQWSRPAAEIEPLLGRLSALGLSDVEEALVRGSRVVSAGDNLYAWGMRNQTPAVKRRVVSMAGEMSRVLGAIHAELLAGPPFDEPPAVLLDRLDPPMLERIADRWQVRDLHYMAKPAVIEILDAMLEGGATRERMLCEVSPESRRLFTYLCEHDGRAPAGAVQAALGWGHAELQRHFAALEVRALAFETLWDDRRMLFVPRQVRAPGDVVARAAPVAVAANPPVVDSRHPVDLPWNLLTTLAHFAQNEVLINRHNNELPKRALKRLEESFRCPAPGADDTYLGLVLHFAETLGLLAEEETPRRKVPGPRLDSWVTLSFAVQLRRLFALWLEDRHLPEEPEVPLLLGRSADLPAARKRLAVHLAACPLDTWLSLDSFLQHVRAVDPYLLCSRDEIVRQYGVKGLRDFEARWMNHEGLLLGSMITGTLLWMGLVDVGRERNGTAVAFRLTPAGAQVLNHPDALIPPESPAQALLVQPNFDVLVLAPDGPAIWALLGCADLARHDHVSVYTLTKDSVLRARSSGRAPAQVQQFLSANSQKPVPQNVMQSIADWGGSYKRVMLQKATLVEVDNAEVLDELLSSRRLKGFIARRLTPTVALIRLPRTTVWTRDDPWQKLAKELKGAGYFPQLAEDPRPAEKPRGRRAASAIPAKDAGPNANGTGAAAAAPTNGAAPHPAGPGRPGRRGRPPRKGGRQPATP